jgi:hypothetical protein
MYVNVLADILLTVLTTDPGGIRVPRDIAERHRTVLSRWADWNARPSASTRRFLLAALEQAVADDPALRDAVRMADPESLWRTPDADGTPVPVIPSQNPVAAAQSVPSAPGGLPQPPAYPPRPFAPPASEDPRIPEARHGMAFAAYIIALTLFGLGFLNGAFVLVALCVAALGVGIHTGARWLQAVLCALGLVLTLGGFAGLVGVFTGDATGVWGAGPAADALCLGLGCTMLPFTRNARDFHRPTAFHPAVTAARGTPASVVVLAVLVAIVAALTLFARAGSTAVLGALATNGSGWAGSSADSGMIILLSWVTALTLAACVPGVLRGALWARALLSWLILLAVAQEGIAFLAVRSHFGDFFAEFAMPVPGQPVLSLLLVAVQLWCLFVLRLSHRAAMHFARH